MDFESETFLVEVAGSLCRDSFTGGAGGRPEGAAAGHFIPVAHAFDARQTNVIQYGDKTGPLDTDGQTIGVLVQAAIGVDGYNGALTGSIAATLGTRGSDTTATGPQVMLAIAFTDMRSDERGPGIQVTGDVANTMHCAKGPSEQQAVATSMTVRRLTPRECERLQGFPDDYTLIPYGRAIRREKLEADWIKYLMRGGVMTFDEVCRAAADGPRYKALGNSWAINCVRWIGRRIDAQLRATARATP